MFDRVVSLGGFCQVYEQLKMLGLSVVRSPFDRLVTPWRGMIDILAEDGERLGQRVTTANNGTSALCMAYGCLYEHDFERMSDRRVILDGEQLATLRAKMLRRMTRLRQELTRSRKTLFVRLAGHAWTVADPYVDDEQALTSADLAQLVAVIEQAYPALDFHVLLVGIDGHTVLDGSIPERMSFATVRSPDDTLAEGAWMGRHEDWQAIMKGVGMLHSEAA